MTDQEVKDELCRRLIEGESLRTICADEDMPSRVTICRWLAADEEFQRQYAYARQMQAEAFADDIIDIADTPVIGTKTVTKATGAETTEGDMIEHRRLQVDARKWVASKLYPKKYGDASLVKLGDHEGNRLPEMDHTAKVVRMAAIMAEHLKGKEP